MSSTYDGSREVPETFAIEPSRRTFHEKYVAIPTDMACGVNDAGSLRDSRLTVSKHNRQMAYGLSVTDNQ